MTERRLAGDGHEFNNLELFERNGNLFLNLEGS